MITHPDIPSDNGFLTSLEQMKELFATKGCQRRFTGATKDQLLAWQGESRSALRRLLGFDTFDGCDGQFFELDTETLDGYTRTKCVLQTESKVYVPLYVLKPADLKPGERRPAMICPHGHTATMKESVAAVRHAFNAHKDFDTYNAQYGEDFVRRGYVVFCPDARGFNERAERPKQDQEWKCSCYLINHMGIPLGRSAAGMSVWDLIKLCDHIVARPDCDGRRIGCAGLSGGGLQALYLAAVDERIACACSSGYFYGVLESLLIQSWNCACNYVPDMWLNFDMGDLAALIAPRPFIVETGLRDALNGEGLSNVTSQLEIAARAYKLLGCEENLAFATFDDGHKWVGAEVYPFFAKKL
jgi:hypothetical protein